MTIEIDDATLDRGCLADTVRVAYGATGRTTTNEEAVLR